MHILVFNCGSSSLNYKLYQVRSECLDVLVSGKAHRVGVKGAAVGWVWPTTGRNTGHFAGLQSLGDVDDPGAVTVNGDVQ